MQKSQFQQATGARANLEKWFEKTEGQGVESNKEREKEKLYWEHNKEHLREN